MTPADRLRGVLTPQLITLATKLLRSYCRREGIRPNHYLRDEVESAAGLAVANVLDAITRGTTPDNVDAYATTAINREMQNACVEDAKQPRCQFSDEYGPNQIVDGDHVHRPIPNEAVDHLSRYCTDDVDREMIALYASGQFASHKDVAKALGKDAKTIYLRLQNLQHLKRIASA